MAAHQVGFSIEEDSDAPAGKHSRRVTKRTTQVVAMLLLPVSLLMVRAALMLGVALMCGQTVCGGDSSPVPMSAAVCCCMCNRSTGQLPVAPLKAHTTTMVRCVQVVYAAFVYYFRSSNLRRKQVRTATHASSYCSCHIGAGRSHCAMSQHAMAHAYCRCVHPIQD